MKPSFHHAALNSPFEDPIVYVRIFRERATLLFDVGNLGNLVMKEIMKITDIFVTHMHIDHFIGFDQVLRAFLRRKKPLHIYGPEGITDCVSGKLRGYSWNLISEYPLKIAVYEIAEGKLIKSSFAAENRFEKIVENEILFEDVLMDQDMFIVKAVILDHGIQALGYRLEEKFHINIDKSSLTRSGLKVGPWLGDLKSAIRKGAYDTVINTGTDKIQVRDLSDLYKITEGQSIAYIMDSSPSNENYRKIVDFVRGCDTLYIEAYFANGDLELAVEKNHLTARLAGRIAREAGIKHLNLLHFSPRYLNDPDRLVAEAMSSFRH